MLERIINVLKWYDNAMDKSIELADILEPKITAKNANPEQIYYQQKLARIEAQILMVR